MGIWKRYWVLPLCVMTACATAEGEGPFDNDEEPDQPVLEPAIEPVAASEILYAPRTLAREVVETGEEAFPPDEIDHTPSARITFADAAAAPIWNSRLGRAEAEPL